MSNHFANMIFNCQAICIVLSFIISLRLISNDKIPFYLQRFFWYPTIGVVTISLALVANNLYRPFIFFANFTNNISLIFHYWFLSFFIIRAIPNVKKCYYLKIIFVTFIFLIVVFLSNDSLIQINTTAFGIANFGLMLFCLLYYYQLFNYIPTLNLLKEPSFWIITGIFFSMSVHIPILVTVDFLHSKISIEIYRLFACISMFCYSIMHLFFIKAYLCAIRLQKT